MTNKERLRRERISSSLRHYFLTEQGRVHREKISRLQSLKMQKFYAFINKDNNELINNNENAK